MRLIGFPLGISGSSSMVDRSMLKSPGYGFPIAYHIHANVASRGIWRSGLCFLGSKKFLYNQDNQSISSAISSHPPLPPYISPCKALVTLNDWAFDKSRLPSRIKYRLPHSSQVTCGRVIVTQERNLTAGHADVTWHGVARFVLRDGQATIHLVALQRLDRGDAGGHHAEERIYVFEMGAVLLPL